MLDHLLTSLFWYDKRFYATIHYTVLFFKNNNSLSLCEWIILQIVRVCLYYFEIVMEWEFVDTELSSHSHFSSFLPLFVYCFDLSRFLLTYFFLLRSLSKICRIVILHKITYNCKAIFCLFVLQRLGNFHKGWVTLQTALNNITLSST